MTAPLLHHHVTKHAQERPQAAAIVFGSDRINYGDLEARSNQLAHMLVASGCVPGDRVCLMIPKNIDAIVSIIGVLKAGCIYTPLDTRSPADRTGRIIQSCEPSMVLVAEENWHTLTAALAGYSSQTPMIGLIDSGDAPDGDFQASFNAVDVRNQSDSNINHGRSESDNAYILFTSGSTGLPKGVPISHRNVTTFVEWANSYFNVTAEDRLSGHTALHFDLSAYDLYGTLFAGAQLHLLPPEVSLLPNKTSDFIRSSKLTQWFTVPSVLNYMHRFNVIKDDDYPDLKHMIWCGEVLPTANLIYLMQKLPHAQFTNLYGPTEATIASSYYTVPSVPVSATEPIPIGVACEGESLHVLDDSLNPVAAGEVGDLFIGGAGLSEGYWRDNEKTSQVFVQSPPQSGSERIYKTGDLAYQDSNGLFYFIGRADTQIKSRGYRIELGEIETALATLDELVESAVVAIETDNFDGKTICCAYSAADNVNTNPATLKTRLQRSIPDYMIPAKWLSLEALPKTGSGKIDRVTLRKLFAGETNPAPVPQKG